MTTQHPAGDGATRPTDREQDERKRLTNVVDGAIRHRLKRASAYWRTNLVAGEAWPHITDAVVDALLAARAPAPPDAAQSQAQALRTAAQYLTDNGVITGLKSWMLFEADRLAAEPDAATRTVQVEQEALAEAWSRGMRTGTSRAMRHMSDEPNLPLASEADNPFRAAADPGTRGEGEDRG